MWHALCLLNLWQCFLAALASGLFVQIVQKDISLLRAAAQGSHKFFHPHIGKQKPLLWRPGYLWKPELELKLGLQCQPQPGAWFEPWPWPWAMPETLGNAGTSTFPNLGVGDIGKLTELVAAALWTIDLDLLGLYEGLDSLSMCIHGLDTVAWIFFRTFLCFLAKLVFLGNVGSAPSEICVLLIGVSWCHFYAIF